MQNHLKDQTSPYLLQHADNPVHWYPWCGEAFARAGAEDKPVFLSIGYSTCHWCHVMAHESFEDAEIAEILNRHFVSIKVDKEERPDIDSIYMSVCQAFTGSGGWPTTIFLTPDQRPFFAGTYFPKTARYGRVGLRELLLAIRDQWMANREELLQSAESVIAALKEDNKAEGDVDERLIDRAVADYKRMFDETFGGFGNAPKFPTPHNLLFLMRYDEKNGDTDALHMVEKTLRQMYLGGMFDHIGGGFSRYSTDRYFLAPHFEKMLYDNALLILAYCKAYQLTGKELYRKVAEKTATYILREMTSPEGGFYSAQDADSEGVEGKYYLFEPSEIIGLLGEEAGKEFNEYFGLTPEGNFEGKNIPNLLHHPGLGERRGGSPDGRQTVEDRSDRIDSVEDRVEANLPAVYEYRRRRYALHLDDKILTNWNGLMIAAMCHLYRVTGNGDYLDAAAKAQNFIERKLWENDTLHISYREGKRSGKGFLDDYANEVFALLALYESTLDNAYLKKADRFCKKAISDFYDEEHGGFFLYGKDNEQLILRPKETYDGAVFSGNSAMAYNLVQLYLITGDNELGKLAECQMKFMCGEAKNYPAGYGMFMLALSEFLDEPDKITIVSKKKQKPAGLACRLPLNTVICVLDEPTESYPLKNGQTTYYVCSRRTCRPPVNALDESLFNRATLRSDF